LQGGGIGYYYLSDHSDQIRLTSNDTSSISDSTVENSVSVSSLIENKVSSSKIEKHTIQDKLKNRSVNEKAQMLISEAESFIKEHNLTLPKNIQQSKQGQNYQTKLEDIDKILEQTEEILNSVDQSGESI